MSKVTMYEYNISSLEGKKFLNNFDESELSEIKDNIYKLDDYIFKINDDNSVSLFIDDSVIRLDKGNHVSIDGNISFDYINRRVAFSDEVTTVNDAVKSNLDNIFKLLVRGEDAKKVRAMIANIIIGGSELILNTDYGYKYLTGKKLESGVIPKVNREASKGVSKSIVKMLRSKAFRKGCQYLMLGILTGSVMYAGYNLKDKTSIDIPEISFSTEESDVDSDKLCYNIDDTNYKIASGEIVAIDYNGEFDSNDCVDKEDIEEASKYDEYFNKYGKMYGIDPTLLRAICAQESSGGTMAYNEEDYADGIMQIAKHRASNEEVLTPYNFETGEKDYLVIKDLENDEYNVQLAAADLQIDFMIAKIQLSNKYGITAEAKKKIRKELLPYTLMIYNTGAGNMENFLYDSVYPWQDNPERHNYYERIFSRLDDGTIINISFPDGDNIKYAVFNMANKKGLHY